MILGEREQELRDLFRYFLFILIVCILVSLFFQCTVVRQTSMVPTFNDGDYLVCNRTLGLIEPKRGDDVIFRANMDVDGTGKQDVLLIKRVVGLPGEKIKSENGLVYVNGKRVFEDYLHGHLTDDFYEVEIPKDSYFCMGDNRPGSIDSRSSEVGFIERRDIRGIELFRLFPSEFFQRVKLCSAEDRPSSGW